MIVIIMIVLDNNYTLQEFSFLIACSSFFIAGNLAQVNVFSSAEQ